jgi:hypothetical protein
MAQLLRSTRRSLVAESAAVASAPILSRSLMGRLQRLLLSHWHDSVVKTES